MAPLLPVGDGDGLGGCFGRGSFLRKYALELLVVLLFSAYIVSLYLKQMARDNQVYIYLYIGTFFAQRLPVAALVAVIVRRDGNPDGPTGTAKVHLVMAAVLFLLSDLPLEMWSSLVSWHHERTATTHLHLEYCPLVFASWIDVVFLIYTLALLLFFLFVRLEFRRNMEETIWGTVAAIQHSFDTREF